MTDDDYIIEPAPIVPMPLDWDARSDVTIPLRGQYEVTTESSSRYLLDFESGYLTRIRGQVDSDNPEVLPASHMRRDGEPLKLLRVLVLQVGREMVVDIFPLGDPSVIAFTRRTTTFVVAIVPSAGFGP